MTWNIHAGRGEVDGLDLERQADFIRESGAEVAMLQEVDRHFRPRSEWKDQVQELADLLGWHAEFGVKFEWPPLVEGDPPRQFVNATLSSYPIIDSETIGPLPTEGIPRPPDELVDEVDEPWTAHQSLLRTRINVRGIHVDVFNTHLVSAVLQPDGTALDAARIRTAQVDAVADEVEQADGPVILSGDFNALTGDGEMKALHRSGLVDVWDVAGEGPGLTGGMSVTADGFEATRRIDYVWVSPGIDIHSAEVPYTEASDHFPVITHLTLPHPGAPAGGQLMVDTADELTVQDTHEATTTFTNAGDEPLRDIHVTLETRHREDAFDLATEPVDADVIATVGPGDSKEITWQIDVPADAAQGDYILNARARYTNDKGTHTAQVRGTAPSHVLYPAAGSYPSLVDAFDNNGISDDEAVGDAALIGSRLSFSEQELARHGFEGGQTFTHGGVAFTVPQVDSDAPDNVTAYRQTIPVTGDGDTLGFLATSVFGVASGAGTINYTDGTQQEYTLEVAPWWGEPSGDHIDIAVPAEYINTRDGSQRVQRVNIYFIGIELADGKTVDTVTLPRIRYSSGPDDPSRGDTSMHIFAISADEA